MTSKKILMLAAENDMLPGAKVGGVGDVIRDLPSALVKEGCEVSVILPSYGFLARLPGLLEIAKLELHFSGFPQQLTLYKLEETVDGVENYIIHSELFAPHGEQVYCNDPDWRPFASDATKFAFYCQAVAQSLLKGLLPLPDVVHLHDWHTAFFLVLREYNEIYRDLKAIPCVYTIHNLAMQGVRPFKNDDSALETWYPDLSYDGVVLADPTFPECFNPMRAAILLADKVNTVSPGYAQEIQQRSQHELGIYGGEGLENELQTRAQAGELFGILNGCVYDRKNSIKKPGKAELVDLAHLCLQQWAGQQRQLLSAHWIADYALDELKRSRKTRFTVTSVGRITDQKALLLQHSLANGKRVLEQVLENLGDKGLFILLGSGDEKLENFFTRCSGRYRNFIFLNGYSDALSKLIYHYGDLFLMPSSFEPCGISQMLAMRAGQPCLVNAVGGLRDTVEHGETGFVFSGENLDTQAQALVDGLQEAKNLWESQPESWSGIRHRAAQKRFSWKVAAKTYLEKMY